MRRIRVIPVLQIESRKLVKTTGFKAPAYVGDPLNALRIFNEKEVDEIAVVDIGATRNKKQPDFEFIRQMASECFMPMAYGGGVCTVEEASEIFQSGIEKIIIGTAFFKNPDIVKRIADKFGSQSVAVSIDVHTNWLGKQKTYVTNGTMDTGIEPVAYAMSAVKVGAGELLLQSIDREGIGKGYDIALIKKLSNAVDVPLIALGGANSIEDFLKAVQAGASAVAAGNMFIYKGPHKAVLINYPDQNSLIQKLYSKI
jgi:cyclase